MPQVTAKQIARMARARGLDPRAVLAVAAQEGLGGGIGDNGTSFGPFQLHYGGAYPSSAPRGAQASQAWAWSPQGISYALDQISRVAGGQHGAQAVRSIVSQFERPADPRTEIARSLAAYGNAPAGASPAMAGVAASGRPNPGSLRGPAAAAPDNRHQLALALLSQVGKTNPDYSSVLTMLEQRHAAAPAPLMPAAQTPPNKVTSGGVTPGKQGSLGFLEPFAKQFGLTITSETGGKHVPTSYHYQGRAVDYAGSADHMRALMEYALAHPEQFKEAFYDPEGRYVKNGRVVKGSIGGHSDHVHLAR